VVTYLFDFKDGTSKELSAMNFIQAILVMAGKGYTENKIQKISIKQPKKIHLKSQQQSSR
jgi:hypothetical protein